MINPTNEPTSAGNELFFAKLLVALALRKTHGIVFAAAFLDEFESEIHLAATGASIRRSQNNK